MTNYTCNDYFLCTDYVIVAIQSEFGCFARNIGWSFSDFV